MRVRRQQKFSPLAVWSPKLPAWAGTLETASCDTIQEVNHRQLSHGESYALILEVACVFLDIEPQALATQWLEFEPSLWRIFSILLYANIWCVLRFYPSFNHMDGGKHIVSFLTGVCLSESGKLSLRCYNFFFTESETCLVPRAWVAEWLQRSFLKALVTYLF